MESDNIVIGKINKKKVYLNNGKYGHYLSCDGKNYKVPEWFPVDKFDIDVAERLIEYKKKCLKCIVMFQKRKQNQQNKMNQKVRKKHLNKPKQKNK
jgi:topoisomerase IA-like protein